jgi:hypothetical protein
MRFNPVLLEMLLKKNTACIAVTKKKTLKYAYHAHTG